MKFLSVCVCALFVALVFAGCIKIGGDSVSSQDVAVTKTADDAGKAVSGDEQQKAGKTANMLEAGDVSYGKLLRFGKGLPEFIEIIKKTPAKKIWPSGSDIYQKNPERRIVNWVIKDPPKYDLMVFGGHKKLLQLLFVAPQSAEFEASRYYKTLRLAGEKAAGTFALLGVMVETDTNKDGLLNYHDDCSLFYYDLKQRHLHDVLKKRQGLVIGESLNEILPVYIYNSEDECIEIKTVDLITKGISTVLDEKYLKKINKKKGIRKNP